jgi:DeoR/GlpR family transcriptional regulator of sugar metabolism
MNANQRRNEILAILEKDNKVNINTLVEQFEVNQMTIRRDLKTLEELGVISLVSGGAELIQGAGYEPSFKLKGKKAMAVKKKIACQAAKNIKSGQVIFIDAGTTCLQIIPFIKQKQITIITNSPPVANEVINKNNITLIMAPGEYNKLTGGCISIDTLEYLRKFNINIAFISTLGVDIENGVSVPLTEEAEIKKYLTNNSHQSVLLFDNSKLNQIYFAKHGNLKDFNLIITNDDYTDEEKDFFKDYPVTFVK